MSKLNRSHGSGEFEPSQFKALGDNVIFEPGVLVFHPETIELQSNVYVGHGAILKGYYKGPGMQVGENTWIGQGCYFHSAGGIAIGRNVGIGPYVKILTSVHVEAGRNVPILHSPIEFSQVEIGDDSDIGVGAIILPGVKIGHGVQVGAGAVVTRSLPDYSVAYGNPAKVQRTR